MCLGCIESIGSVRHIFTVQACIDLTRAKSVLVDLVPVYSQCLQFLVTLLA